MPRRKTVRTSSPQPIGRGHILLGGQGRSHSIQPMDEETTALARDLTAALLTPLTADELAAADIEVVRWERASALLDALCRAANTGSLDLVMVEGEHGGRSQFFIEAWMPRTKHWQRVAVLLLADEDAKAVRLAGD